MIFEKDNFMIRTEKVEDKDYLNEILSIYDYVRKFFRFGREIENDDIKKIRLCFVYDPQEFVFFSSGLVDNFQNWIVGGRMFKTIIVFSPSVIEKYTTHKKSEIKGIIAHELAHMYYEMHNLPQQLQLINEGLAKYIKLTFEKSLNYLEQPTKVEDKLSLKGTKDFKNNYLTGAKLVSNIFKQDKGKEKLLYFLKSVGRETDDSILKNKFFEIFGVTPKEMIELKGGNENNQ